MLTSNVAFPDDVQGVATLFGDVYVATQQSVYHVACAASDPSNSTQTEVYDLATAGETINCMCAWGGKLFIGTALAGQCRIIELERLDPLTKILTATVEWTAVAGVNPSAVLGIQVRHGTLVASYQYVAGGLNYFDVLRRNTIGTWSTAYSSASPDLLANPTVARKRFAAGDSGTAGIQLYDAGGVGISVVQVNAAWRNTWGALGGSDFDVALNEHGDYWFAILDATTSYIATIPASVTKDVAVVLADRLADAIEIDFETYIGETILEAEVRLGQFYRSAFYAGFRHNYDPGTGAIDKYVLCAYRNGEWRERTVASQTAPFLVPYGVIEVDGNEWLACLDVNQKKHLYFFKEEEDNWYAVTHWGYRI